MNDVGDYEIRAAQYEIEEALEREQNPEFDMAAYVTDHPTANTEMIAANKEMADILMIGKVALCNDLLYR